MAEEPNVTTKVSISRMHGGQHDTCVVIEVRDVASGIVALRVKLSPEEFALAITGLAERPAVEAIWRTDRLGLTREFKTEVVPWDSFTRNAEEATMALTPFEVDGWRGRAEDLHNSHKRAGRGHQNVHFERWVKSDG